MTRTIYSNNNRYICSCYNINIIFPSLILSCCCWDKPWKVIIIAGLNKGGLTTRSRNFLWPITIYLYCSLEAKWCRSFWKGHNNVGHHSLHLQWVRWILLLDSGYGFHQTEWSHFCSPICTYMYFIPILLRAPENYSVLKSVFRYYAFIISAKHQGFLQ